MNVTDILKSWLKEHDFDGLVKNAPPEDGDCCGCDVDCLGYKCDGESLADCHPGFLAMSPEDGEFWFVFDSRVEFKAYLEQEEKAQNECPNCFEGKSAMDHICKHCNGTGISKE